MISTSKCGEIIVACPEANLDLDSPSCCIRKSKSGHAKVGVGSMRTCLYDLDCIVMYVLSWVEDCYQYVW